MDAVTFESRTRQYAELYPTPQVGVHYVDGGVRVYAFTRPSRAAGALCLHVFRATTGPDDPRLVHDFLTNAAVGWAATGPECHLRTGPCEFDGPRDVTVPLTDDEDVPSLTLF